MFFLHREPRLRSIPGWHADMEAADQLHNLWIGCAKDSLASVFCDIIEYHPMFRGSESWDEALAQLCTLLHDYCDRSGLEKAVIDEISLTKLSIKSITYDFPAAFSKGWANRVGAAFAADFLKNTDVEELKVHSVLTWAITEYAWILEQAEMWLTDEQALQAASAGNLYLEAHVYLARKALLQGRPRFKVRPRLHSFACETVAKLENGSRMNPKYCATWSDESYIGQVCSIGKSTAVHTSTIGLRLLQRLMLHLNAVWSATEKRGPVYLCSSRGSRDLIVCTPELPIDTGQLTGS